MVSKNKSDKNCSHLTRSHYAFHHRMQNAWNQANFMVQEPRLEWDLTKTLILNSLSMNQGEFWSRLSCTSDAINLTQVAAISQKLATMYCIATWTLTCKKVRIQGIWFTLPCHLIEWMDQGCSYKFGEAHCDYSANFHTMMSLYFLSKQSYRWWKASLAIPLKILLRN